MTNNPVWRWIDSTFIDLIREFRWSYLPPLMIYLAFGVQGLTAIAGTFFIKEYLDLSAAFLASLGFWTIVPYVLKMPLGHLVDLIWRHKALLVYVGAGLLAASLLMMYGVIAHTAALEQVFPIKIWFVIAVLLAPTGYALQDVVADAMTIEAVPTLDDNGNKYSDAEIKAMHTTMQTLGRVAMFAGLIAVAILNITVFDGAGQMTEAQKIDIYGDIYLIALVIPIISVSGVMLGRILMQRRARQLEAAGHDHRAIDKLLFAPAQSIDPNWWILGGSLAFALFTITMGLSDIPLSQEIVFIGSMAIVLFLMHRLFREIDADMRRVLIGTALVIFVFRATPGAGPGLGWFEIDELGFDQQFLSVLSLIASTLTLLGMLVLRPMLAHRSIVFVIVVLSIAGAVLALPNLGMYYGVHEWTSAHTSGVVDARFIAIMDTAMESPLGQIAMIPMLAWVAKNASDHLKATFFAVMAAFTNLALSASSLGTKYMNQIYTVTREIRDRATDTITTMADYSELGMLLITVVLIGLLVPLITVYVVQRSPWRTLQ